MKPYAYRGFPTIKPRTTCPDCGLTFTVNADGMIRKHTWGDEPCPGSGWTPPVTIGGSR